MASLGRATASDDRAAVTRRLDLPAIRASLTHQLVNAYWDATGRRPPPGVASYASDGAAAMANPLVSQYVTEDSILDFLERGSVASAGTSGKAGFSMAKVWPLVRDAEQRGFTKVAFRLPPDAARQEQYGIVLRLKDFAWRVGGVELPLPLRDRIVKRMIRDHGQTGALAVDRLVGST
jgi:hypothetical protein